MEIKKVGYSKVSIFLKTRKAANDLVSDLRLKERDLIAFISPSRISRKGIIRNVPLDLANEMILENISSPIKITSVKRLNRRMTDVQPHDKEEGSSPAMNYSPSYTVMIIFEGQKISKSVALLRQLHCLTLHF